MRAQQIRPVEPVTTISRMQRESATADPSDVERAARDFLESKGKPAFTHFTVKNKGRRRSIIHLFSEPRNEAKKFDEPLVPEDLAYLLPWIKAKSSYPPKPENCIPVVKGLTLLSSSGSFVMVGTWCEPKEKENE